MKEKRSIFSAFMIAVAAFCIFSLVGGVVFAAEDSGEEISVNIVGYAGDASFSFFQTEDKALYAMGDNSLGQLGTVVSPSDFKTVYVPEQVGNLPAITDVVVSPRHVLALAENGKVYSWGNNAYGQMGLYGSETFVSRYITDRNAIKSYIEGRDSSTPQEILFDSGVHIAQMAASSYNSFFLDSDGGVWALGQNEYGQLGCGREIGKTSFESEPVRVKTPDGNGDLENIIQVACANTTAFAVAEDGALYAWGSDYYGLLGDGGTAGGSNFTKANLPVEIELQDETGPLAVSEIQARDTMAIIRTENGKMFFLGQNSYGQAADRSVAVSTIITSPHEITYFNDNGIEIKQLLVGGSTCFVLDANGEIYAWGLHDSNGGLGLGVYDELPADIKPENNPLNRVVVPTKIVFEDGIVVDKMLGTAGLRTFVADTAGGLWAWGNNAYGQLGNKDEGENNYAPSLIPVRSTLERSGSFVPALSNKNYLTFPIVFICVVVALLIVWIVYLSFKNKQMLKLEAEYDNSARLRYENLFSERIKRFMRKLFAKNGKDENN